MALTVVVDAVAVKFDGGLTNPACTFCNHGRHEKSVEHGQPCGSVNSNMYWMSYTAPRVNPVSVADVAGTVGWFQLTPVQSVAVSSRALKP